MVIHTNLFAQYPNNGNLFSSGGKGGACHLFIPHSRNYLGLLEKSQLMPYLKILLEIRFIR